MTSALKAVTNPAKQNFSLNISIRKEYREAAVHSAQQVRVKRQDKHKETREGPK